MLMRSLLTSRTSLQRAGARSITTGTDLTKTTTATLQLARPWFMSDDEGSNLAVDNAQTMTDLFKGKTVAVFGVPAPFTGTCTHAHYPPYKNKAADFKKAGVDAILCYSVTDPYAHHGWATKLGNNFDDITFVADTDAAWAKEHDLSAEYAGPSLGVRSKRFSMLVKDGIVKTFHIVDEAENDADVLLGEAQAL
jgi:peroxiredoxin